jgi:hypothetical protein
MIEDTLLFIDSLSDMYYEDGEASNSEVVDEKSKNMFRRAFDAVMKFINSLIEKIKTLFQRMGLSKEEKKEFDEIRKAIMADPNIKNKSFTVDDYRKAKAQEEAIIKEMEAIQKSAEQAGNDEQEAEIINNGMEKVKGMMSGVADVMGTAGKSIATTIGAQQILHMAESNRTFAQMVYGMLEKEEGFAKQLEDAIGTKQSNKFKKSIKSCTKWLSWHKFKATIFGTICNDMSKSFSHTVKDLKELANPKNSIGANIARARHLNMANNVIGGINQQYGTDYTLMDVAKAGKQIKTTVNDTKKTVSDATGFVRRTINNIKNR